MKQIFCGFVAFMGFLNGQSVESIDNYINKSLLFWNVPGASVTIVKDNNIVLCKGFGYKTQNQDQTNKVNANTLFPIASLTKSFTAEATDIFIKEKGLNWD